MAQANIDLGVIQEKHFTGGVYSHESEGYHVVKLYAPSRHRGAVALFYQELIHFALCAYQ